MPQVRQSVPGPTMDFSNAFTLCTRMLALASAPFAPHGQERWKGLRPVVFNPCTLVRTWGTRPVPKVLPLQFESCQTSRPLWLAPLVKSDSR